MHGDVLQIEGDLRQFRVSQLQLQCDVELLSADGGEDDGENAGEWLLQLLPPRAPGQKGR